MHFSTVYAYLNHFRNNLNIRSQYSRLFFKYLLSVCWPKIYRQVASWRGLGFIYNLFHYKFNSDDVDWSSNQYDVDHEHYLVGFLSQYENVVEGLTFAFISAPQGSSNDWKPPDKNFPHFQHLMSAIKQGKPQLYSKDTAEDFHRLVYATLVTFGRSLCRFGVELRLHGKDVTGEGLKKVSDCFAALRAQTELLVFLLTSSTFK